MVGQRHLYLTFVAEIYYRHKLGIIPFAIIFMAYIGFGLPDTRSQDVAKLRALCGDSFSPNLLLVTRGQESRELQQLRTDPQLWQPLIIQGAQVIEVKGPSSESALKVLDHLPAGPPSKPLHIQLATAKAQDIRATSAYWKLARGSHKWYCRLRHELPGWRCVCGWE